MKRKTAPSVQHIEPYTDEFIESVARKFRIPPEQIGKLRSCLDNAAWAYTVSLRAPTWEQQNWQTRKALEHIEATYLEFAQAIAQLPTVARDHLWDPIWENPNRLPGFSGLANLAGIYADESAFRRILEDFGKRITVRLQNEPNVPCRGGRPGLNALRNFVRMAAVFWADELGRKFTYSEVDGRPKSDAYDFCWAIVHPLAPEVTPQQLSTAVKAMVKPLKVTVRIHPSLMRKDR
jgi:hypothetical protein